MKLSIPKPVNPDHEKPCIGDVYRNTKGNYLLVCGITDRRICYYMTFDHDGVPCGSGQCYEHYLAQRVYLGTVDPSQLTLQLEYLR